MSRYARNFDQLEAKAAVWWPPELIEAHADAGVVSLLLQTQDKFISLLKLGGKSPETIFDLLGSSDLPGNLFLKHLMVLTDFGGETLQRVGKRFGSLFRKEGRRGYILDFYWGDRLHHYRFNELPVNSLDNKKLGVDGPSIIEAENLSPLHKDVAMILLFGSAHNDNEVAGGILSKCDVGLLIGRPEAIDRYVSQRYIIVSRIIARARSNALGQAAQTYVMSHLSKKLEKGYKIKRNGKVKLKSGDSPFDVVVEKKNCSVGIEVSFQVTTNSTIERKANEAAGRQKSMHESGHAIAYVVDGAGNFQRRSAVSKICDHSDCTVAYKDGDLDILAKFIRGFLG